MIFWFTCAALTAAVVFLTFRPMLSRGRAVPSPESADLLVYKDQLSELDRDIARGLLTTEEAKAARIEVSRRILAADAASVAAHSLPQQTGASTPSLFTNTVVSLSALIVASGAIGLYLVNGSPGYEAQSFAIRASTPPSAAPVNELIARVEARLRESPDDGLGWDVLAPVYLKQQRAPEAIHAYTRAIELLGENVSRLRGLAESYLAATNGQVIREVREAFGKILAIQPKLIAPRFWLAVGLEQDGDKVGAAAAYRALLEESSAPDGQEMPPALQELIRERLAAVSQPAAEDRESSQDGKGPPPPPGSVDGLSSQEQSAMIEQMVAGLSARLDKDGGNVSEWQRLIRAYTVMGRREDAAAALAKAKQQFAGQAEVIGQLDAFAKSLAADPG